LVTFFQALQPQYVPDDMPLREREMELICSFIARTVRRALPGCLYISGPPGTGKTASVNVATRLLKESTNSKIKTNFVHCMSEANTRVFLSTLLGCDHAADASCDDQVLAALYSLHFCNIWSSSVRLSDKPGSNRSSSSSTSATACWRGVTISCRGYLRCLSARAVSLCSSASRTQVSSKPLHFILQFSNICVQLTSCHPSCRCF
jgi:DNA polymerase III delta prime subunit